MRLYDVSEGSVVIDGQDIRTVTQASLRKNIGVVFQDPSLFSGTIKENISYANPKATNQQIIAAARAAMDNLLLPMREYNHAQKRAKKGPYKPRMVLTLGNHENRINRAVDEEPMLDGTISVNDLPYEDWEVIPFLEPIVIEGVAFAHYFTSGVMGRPVGTAQLMLNKKHMSCFAGHQQGRNIAYGLRADGTEMTAIISGSCYTHDEPYLNPQTNNHWRGVWVLHDVRDGAFDEMPLSLSYLEKKYGNTDQH
jgi:ABC-type Fe3+/spermidine/putrescine transport system ATPase subunit